MKISRSSDYLSVTVTRDELASIARELGRTHSNQLACWARYIASNDEVELYFGHGRTFRPSGKDGVFWTVALDAYSCGAQQLELFGMTPTTYQFGPGKKLIIAIPGLRAPLRRRKPVMEKARPYIPASRQPFGLKPVRPVEPEPVHHVAFVSEDELLRAKDVFNRALDRGFKPQFDARGKILFFDRRVAD